MRAPPGQPRHRHGGRRVGRLAPRQHDPGDERRERHARDRDQGAAPAVRASPRAGPPARPRRSSRSGCPSCRRPCPQPGRCSKCSLTEIGASALPSPIPIPTGQVRRTTSHTDGIDGPEDAEDADQREADRHRAPRPDPGGEIGRDGREQAHAEDGDRARAARRPHATSRTRPGSTGSAGRCPTICGRSVSAARKSATSVAVAVGRRVTSGEREERESLHRGDPRQQPPGRRSPGSAGWRGAQRTLPRRRTLEDEEPVGVVGVLVRVVLEAPGLGARERRHRGGTDPPGRRARPRARRS